MARMKQREPAAQVRGSRPIQLTLVTSAGRITAAPAQFYGVPVSVHGQVARTFGPHVFTLQEEAWWSFGGNLPVLVPMPRPGSTLDANDFITVTGTVRPFVRVEIERDYDWFDFDALPDLNANLKEHPDSSPTLPRRRTAWPSRSRLNR